MLHVSWQLLESYLSYSWCVNMDIGTHSFEQ